MVWNEATRRETRAILERIPPLSWRAFEDLFDTAGMYAGKTRPDRFTQIQDPEDPGGSG